MAAQACAAPAGAASAASGTLLGMANMRSAVINL